LFDVPEPENLNDIVTIVKAASLRTLELVTTGLQEQQDATSRNPFVGFALSLGFGLVYPNWRALSSTFPGRLYDYFTVSTGYTLPSHVVVHLWSPLLCSPGYGFSY
jgi:hypothetical protein